MNRSGSFRRAVAADAPRKREFPEEQTHPVLVLIFIRIDLGIRALEINRGQHARRAVTWTSDKNRVEVVLVDEPVEMNIGETQARTGTPMAEQALLDMIELQRLPQQGIVL